MTTARGPGIGPGPSPVEPERTTFSASGFLALALNVPAWVLFLMGRDAAREEFLGGIGEFMLALAFAGVAALVAGMGLVAAGIDARDRGESVWPSIALGLAALGVSIGSIVLFCTIGADGASIIGP